MIDYPLRGHGRWGSTPQDHQRDRPRGNWESDNALDIAVPRGTPVYAVADGTIGRQFGPLNSSDPQLLGLRLHLTTNDNEYYYAHLSEFAPGIQPGVAVHRGDLLGYSGEAAGVAHLHFAVRHGDPTIILRNAREHTGPETRQGFQPTEGKSSNNLDGRTLDQILGPADPPMTPQEINDLLNAASGERSDAQVQAEKQQGMENLMKEIGADEPKQSIQSPETLQRIQPRSDGGAIPAPPTLPDDGFDTTIHDGNAFRRDDDATNSNVGKVEVYPKIENPLDALKPAPKEGPLPMGPFDFSPEGNLSDPYPGPSDGRTLDQLLGPPDRPMTPQDIDDLLNAAPGERNDAEVQAEKQQGMDALMKEIGAAESKQSFQSPETLQGRVADGNLNYTPAVENTSNITNRGDTYDAKGYSGGSSDTVGYDGGHPDAGGYDAGRPDANGASDGGAEEAP